MKKNKGLRIRVEEDLREDFTQACQVEGKTASDVLREFMRIYVEQQPGRLQRPLFEVQAGARRGS